MNIDRHSSAVLHPTRWTLRARSALASAGVVGVALLVGAFALLAILHHSLTGAVDAAARSRATEITAQLVKDSPADLDATLFASDARIVVAQVIASDGTVVRSSGPQWRQPLIDARLLVDRKALTGSSATSGKTGADLRVSTAPARSADGPVTVLVGASAEGVESTLRTLAVLLAIGGPLIMLVAAVATWGLVGRSLRSVEALRSRVAAIGTRDLSTRVPVPAPDDEIAWLATTMNAMLARIEAGQLAQRRFVGDASHELRSPLATLTAALELARDRPEIFDRALLTETLLPESARMRRLVADLLVLARADETGMVMHTEQVDLDEVADAEASILRHRSSIAVVRHTAPARVLGDRASLARVIRNLLDNAATHAGSRITITTASDALSGQPTARIVVDDDGAGIPAADRERVFDRFIRLQDDRSRASGGTGLGLAIVTEIVAAHGGTVIADSSPLGGARFVVELPAADLPDS